MLADAHIRRPAQHYDCGIGYGTAIVISLAWQDREVYEQREIRND